MYADRFCPEDIIAWNALEHAIRRYSKKMQSINSEFQCLTLKFRELTFGEQLDRGYVPGKTQLVEHPHWGN